MSLPLVVINVTTPSGQSAKLSSVGRRYFRIDLEKIGPTDLRRTKNVTYVHTGCRVPPQVNTTGKWDSSSDLGLCSLVSKVNDGHMIPE